MGIKIRTFTFGSTSAKNLDVLIKKKHVVYQGLSHMPIKRPYGKAGLDFGLDSGLDSGLTLFDL